ncbi:MAG: hypothetical protein O7E52_18095, partial [Candidatus Poribacteria bacterium]|nr:hypothetical protein [Candidatus Poribacteria bacterium]
MLPDSTLAELDEKRRQAASDQQSGADSQDPVWPTLNKSAAYHGVIGDLVKTIEPQTESDPAAILFQGLALSGCC